MVTVFLANGFEEVEALTVVDILRRGEVEVETVSIGGKVITGAHGISVTADVCEEDYKPEGREMIVLPGGQPGTDHLDASETVQKALDTAVKENIPIAAICAAPMVLGHKGLLVGKKATCYPGCGGELTGAVLTSGDVVIDGNIITSRGPATASAFGFALLARLKGEQTANEILTGMLF